MLTIDEAFRKFKSRLELNEKETTNASNRQQEVGNYLDTKFKIDRSFLTESCARWTKTKPLKYVDIFFVIKGIGRPLLVEVPIGYFFYDKPSPDYVFESETKVATAFLFKLISFCSSVASCR